jgi:hypothetical protein
MEDSSQVQRADIQPYVSARIFRGQMERRQQTRIDDTELQEFFRTIEDAFRRKFQRELPGEARRYLNLAEQVVRNSEQELRNEPSREGLRP